MRKIVGIVLIVLLLASFGYCQNTAEDPKYKVTPTEDKGSPSGLYIPKDIEDCFKELEKMLHPDLIQEMKSGTELDMAQHHFGLGRWMRNNWQLWGISRLSAYFNGLGVHHPDNMSGIILTSFWRHLNNKPIEFDKQIEHCKEWERVNAEPPKDGFPETKGELVTKGGRSYTKPDGGPGSIHIYEDASSGELWLFEHDQGWYRPSKEFIEEWNKERNERDASP